MARILPIDPPYHPSVEYRLKAMMGGEGDVEPLKLFRTFVTNMPFSEAMGPLGAYFLRASDRGGPSYDVRTRELVINRVCVRCRCEYEWGVHVTIFKKAAKLSDDQIHAIVYLDHTAPCWSPKDADTIEMVDCLHDTGHLPEALFERLTTHFSEKALIELLMLNGWYHAISYFANGSEIGLEDWAMRFPKKRCSVRPQ